MIEKYGQNSFSAVDHSILGQSPGRKDNEMKKPKHRTAGMLADESRVSTFPVR
jgi:hypothetical protein